MRELKFWMISVTIIVIILIIIVSSILLLNKLNSQKEVIDCKENLSCFIENSKNKDLSKVNLKFSITLFGSNITQISTLEIKEFKDDNCTILFKRISYNVSYSQFTIEKLLNEGKTETEILEMELQANKEGQRFAGTESTCIVNTKFILDILKSWEEEIYSSSDMKALKNYCDGNYF